MSDFYFQCPPCPGVHKVSEGMSPFTCTLHPAPVLKQWDARWARASSKSVVVESNTGPNRLSWPIKDHHPAEMSPLNIFVLMSGPLFIHLFHVFTFDISDPKREAATDEGVLYSAPSNSFILTPIIELISVWIISVGFWVCLNHL